MGERESNMNFEQCILTTVWQLSCLGANVEAGQHVGCCDSVYGRRGVTTS